MKKYWRCQFTLPKVPAALWSIHPLAGEREQWNNSKRNSLHFGIITKQVSHILWRDGATKRRWKKILYKQGVSVGWGRVRTARFLRPHPHSRRDHSRASERDGDEDGVVPIPLTGTGVIAEGARMGTTEKTRPHPTDTPWYKKELQNTRIIRVHSSPEMRKNRACLSHYTDQRGSSYQKINKIFRFFASLKLHGGGGI